MKTLLSVYKIFSALVNNINVIRFSCSVRYFCPILTKLGNSQNIFVEIPSVKFHENWSNGNRVDVCGQTDRLTDGETDLTKKLKAFRDLPERADEPGVQQLRT
jgi:hypothetical protein